MKIVCLKEEDKEHRVALVPKYLQKFISLGFDVEVEENLGKSIAMSRNLPIYEPRELFLKSSAIEETLED